MNKKHYPFPKIRQYHQVLRDLKLHYCYVGKDEMGDPIYDMTRDLPEVIFKGYTKLHGTNAAIVFSHDGSFYCQSRENVIDEIKDNAGFAHWVNKEGYKIFDQIKDLFDVNTVHVIVFGEFCGGSIQKGVALNQLSKMFVVFGVKIISGDESTWYPSGHIKDESINVFNVTRGPEFSISVDLNRPDKAIEQMTKWVDEIDAVCPFAKTFGVDGHGEGIVFSHYNGNHGFSTSFKVKGESHSESKIKKLPTVDVERMNSIQQAVEIHCHEDRLEQGWNILIQNEEDKVPQKIADFIRWIINDLWEEEGDSIRASDISRKEIGAAVSKKAARWFQERLKVI